MENQTSTDEQPKRKRRSGWDTAAPVSHDIPQQSSHIGKLKYKY